MTNIASIYENKRPRKFIWGAPNVYCETPSWSRKCIGCTHGIFVSADVSVWNDARSKANKKFIQRKKSGLAISYFQKLLHIVIFKHSDDLHYNTMTYIMIHNCVTQTIKPVSNNNQIVTMKFLDTMTIYLYYKTCFQNELFRCAY